MSRLEGKVALITGGTSGIGEAAVRRFAAEGASVVIAARRTEKGEALARETGALFVRIDVSKEDDVRAAVDAAVASFGRLDCVFNNAGEPLGDGPLHVLTEDALARSTAVLLGGVVYGVKHAARVMQERGGSIVNNASIAGLQAGYAYHLYSALKAAVIQFTRTAAMELAPRRIRVNSICPGGVATPIFGRAYGLTPEQAESSLNSVVRPWLASAQPMPAACEPDDIAGAALYLACDESRFITGHALVVDGGATAGRRWSDTVDRFGELRAGLRAGAS
jgi:NAD(P)-dependent dehydrogenase (short-subunit alcohol dehydrogenase family)